MNDPQSAGAAIDVVSGLVNMFKDAGIIYWAVTIYSILIGAAMAYIGRRHLKKLLFFVGAFVFYLLMHYFTSEAVAITTALVAGLVFVFIYPIYVFVIGMYVGAIPWALICVILGIQNPGGAMVGIGLVCAIAGGIAAIKYRKHIVIPLTAITGGPMLAIGLAFLFGGINPVLFLLLIVLFTASGIFVQYKFTAKNQNDVKEPEPAK